MALEEQETDYGLSSDAESPFDTFASTKKASNTENTQTSILFISQHDEAGKRENVQQSSNINTEIASEKLVAWAARLELESMTLKDSLTEHIDKISLGNSEQIRRLNDTTLLRLALIDDKLSKYSETNSDKNHGIENDEQLYGKKLGKLDTDLKTVKDKVNKLHANMIDKKLLMTCLSTNQSKTIETLHNALEQSVAASQATLPGPIKRELNLFSSKALECLVTTNIKLHELQVQVEKQSEHLKELQESLKNKFVALNSPQNDSPPSDINAIKNFLRLLLPRIIGLEEKFDSISLLMNKIKEQKVGEESINRAVPSYENTIANTIVTERQSKVTPAAKRFKRS